MPRQGDEPVPGYRLERRLGRGSFGEVWSARGPGGTLAALKFMSVSEKHGLREFRAIQRIKQIRHANLMPIIGIWLIDQNGKLLDEEFLENWDAKTAPAPAMRGTLCSPLDRGESRPTELVEAMPLGDQDLLGRLEACRDAGQQGIAPDELLEYLEDAAKAIDFLNSARHDLGEGPVAIHHGDIKPQNIMIVGDSAQVCDFGLARILGASPATKTALAGSPAYMAPECIRDNRPHSATDQYALAITYVELRTGALPFDSDSYLEVLQVHQEGKLNLLALSPAERSVIERATSLDPAARFESTLDMVRALRRALLATTPEELSDHRSAYGSHAAGSTASSAGTLRSTLRDKPAEATHDSLGADPALQELPTNRPRSRRFVSAIAGVVLTAGVVVAALWLMRGTFAKNDATPSAMAAKAPKAIDALAEPPANSPPQNPPTHELIEVEPAEPQAGGILTVQMRGHDSNHGALTYQYRLNGEDPWTSAVDGRVQLEDLAAGPLQLETRVMNEQGLVSEVVARRWRIALPNRPPTVDIVAAPERLKAGETLHLTLAGMDPDDDSVAFEWRAIDGAEWKRLQGNELELADLEAGQLEIMVRAVDARGAASRSMSRAWTVEPTPGSTPDAFYVALFKSINTGNAQEFWRCLPAKYQGDMTLLVRSAAAKIDSDLYRELILTIDKLARLGEEKKDWTRSSLVPLFAPKEERDQLDSKLQDRWSGVIALLRAIVKSDMKTQEGLANIDVDQFLAGSGQEILRRAAPLLIDFAEAKAPNDPRTWEMIRSGRVDVKVVSRAGDSAVVRLSWNDVDYQMKRVEGKWLPIEMADQWDPWMSQAKQFIAEQWAFLNADKKEEKLAALKVLDRHCDEVLRAPAGKEQANAPARIYWDLISLIGFAME